jgi:nucleotide-binding universal stress UspA family protein
MMHEAQGGTAMIQTILFPTDGSPLSERAFPIALDLARAQHAGMVVAQVVQYLGWLDIGPEAYLSAGAYQEIVDAMDADARTNLDALVSSAETQGIRVESMTLHGSPASELVMYEEQLRPDLVVMATHGRTGFSRFALGSVADTILREGTAPVLLVRSFGTPRSSLERALVPLDGSALAEKVFPMVKSLAGAPVKQFQLWRAVDESSELSEANAYLDKIARQMHQDIPEMQVIFNASVGEPSEIISEAAYGVDLVVMATHGRGGLNRLRHGSVADRALHDLPVPVLLVRSGTKSARQPVVAAALSAEI